MLREPVDLAELVRTALRSVQGLTADRSVRLVDDTVRVGVVAVDPTLVEVAVACLVENALRYAPDGDIVVTTAVIDGACVIEVVDRGPGIPIGERERVFEEFVRGEGVHDATGAGIGLTIARAFVEGPRRPAPRRSHAGRRCHLRDAPAVRATNRRGGSMSSQGDRVSTVLVVEDDAPLRSALRAGLRAQSMEVIDVADAAAAISALAHAIPDLVLLDLNLPGVDGFAVLTRARELSQVPVVVLTVREDRDDKIRALDAGADDYITKPFDAEELHARVRAALRRSSDAGAAAPIAEAHGVVIDLGAARVTRAGRTVRLTKAEWKIIALLVTEAGGLVTHARLLAELGRPTDADVTSLRVHVNHLRRKLGDTGGRALLIVNEPGLGYRWLPEPDSGS